MEQGVLKKQAKLFIEIIDNLNRIEKVIYENEIVDSQSLFVDRDIFDSLCHKALKIYDIHPATILKNKDKYGHNRAQLAHITEKVRTEGLNGFDIVNPDELWKKNFCESMPEIKNAVKEIIEEVPKLAELINKLSGSEIKPPIKILEASDFTHLKIIKDISKDISEQTICLVSLLKLMSTASSPPVNKTLFYLVINITGGNSEQINFIVNELVRREILSWSANKNYLFIIDDSFAINATRDFIDNNDINNVMQLIRETP